MLFDKLMAVRPQLLCYFIVGITESFQMNHRKVSVKKKWRPEI